MEDAQGINLKDGKIYRIAMLPDGRRDTVVPESFLIILRQYLQHPEVKSLAPDGSACVGRTCGLLRRSIIVASELVSIGKETDRHWEQGEDPSMVDFKMKEYGKAKLVVADPSDRRKWKGIGVRSLMRKSSLSQKAVYAVIAGKPVRKETLASFRKALDSMTDFN